MSRRRSTNAAARSVSVAAARSHYTQLLHLLFLTAVTFALYARGLWNGFVTDDEGEVLQDQLIRSLANIPKLFAHNVWFFVGAETHNFYRPLKLVAYSIEYQLFGFRASSWHVVSILLHGAVVIAGYLLVRDLASRRLAFWSALLFALHPVHVEAVAWIAGGQDLICALALLLSTWLYHRARSGASPLLHYGLSAALFFAGLLAKEVALTFPAVILSYDFFYRCESWREMLRAWRRYLPYFGVMGIYFLLRVHALKGFAPITTGMRLTRKEMVLSVPVLAVKYLWLALVPTSLSYWHIYAPTRALGWEPLAAMALVLGLVVFTFWLRRVQPMLSFALAWFWLTLAPVLAIPKVSSNVFTERYLYIPSFAFCVFAAWGWVWLYDRAFHPAARRTAYAGLIALVAFYSVLVVRRLPDWRDTLTLLEKTAQQSPDSPYVAGALGYIYLQQDRFEEALRYEQRAVEFGPHIWTLWMNLGAIYNATRQWEKAIDACRHGLSIEPNNAMLLNQLGLALWQNGQRDQGLNAWRHSVQLDPTDLQTRVNLATSLYQLGQLDAAVNELLAGLRAGPDSRTNQNSTAIYLAHFKLGYIYEERHEWQTAAQEYQQVLEIKSDFAPAREQLEAVRALSRNPQP
jgi:protein O-mannosyl-transferase